MTPRLPAARTIALAALGLGLLASLAANLPGQLSYDSVVQLADARTGVYHTWHPAIMAWAMGLGDAVLPGTALYVAAVATLAFGSLTLVVATRPRVGWAGAIVAGLLAASPLLLLEQGIVWKDVLFADTAVGGFVLLSIAAQPERTREGRMALTLAAAALLVLATLVRQNGVIAPAFAALAVGRFAWGMHPELATRPRLGRAGAVGGGLLVIVLICAAIANMALMTRKAPDDVGAGGQLRVLKIYDLVGVAKRAPGVDLSPLHASGLDAHIRAALAVYTPLQNDPVTAAPGIDDAVTNGAPGLDEAWRKAILQHPGAWLAHRLEVFRWIALPPDVSRCTAVYTGVDGPPEVLQQLNIKSAWRAQDIKLAHYAQAFVRTPLYSHAAWGLLALVLIGVLVAGGRADDAVLAAMLAAALAYAASYLLIGIACDHRYLYVLDLSAMAALLRVACDPPTLQALRRPSPPRETAETGDWTRRPSAAAALSPARR